MTEKQRQASRANGAKSHGPTSPEGKATSSQNATRFGLYAKSIVIRGEDPAEFDARVDYYYQTFHPVGAAQEALVATLVRSEWLLVRLNTLEHETWERSARLPQEPDHKTPLAQAFHWGADEFKLLQRRLDSADRTYRRTLRLPYGTGIVSVQVRPALPTAG